jgi:fructose-bisphosphate aldolase class I
LIRKSYDFPRIESNGEGLGGTREGLLAADESFGTIEKRFKAINIASTQENRRGYRDMLSRPTRMPWRATPF